MTIAERALTRILTANNNSMAHRSLDAGQANPRSLRPGHWSASLEADHPLIRAEWDSFVAGGNHLPHIEDIIDENQGNDGNWRAGLLVSRGRPLPTLQPWFSRTTHAVLAIPGIWSALWSVLEPGAELPEHVGPNAGMLRYHLGVDCGQQSALRVNGIDWPYQDGGSILFDDTAPHAAWNHGDRPRVTLFCEVRRPATGIVGLRNEVVQRLLALDDRYQSAPTRAAEWHRALNG